MQRTLASDGKKQVQDSHALWKLLPSCLLLSVISCCEEPLSSALSSHNDNNQAQKCREINLEANQLLQEMGFFFPPQFSTQILKGSKLGNQKRKKSSNNNSNSFTGTSLVVQWLSVCALNTVGTSSIPDQGTKIPHAAWVWPQILFKKHLTGKKPGIWIMMQSPCSVYVHPSIPTINTFECLTVVICSEYIKKKKINKTTIVPSKSLSLERGFTD